MRIKEDFSEEAAVAFNIISLIDIVFFLLIFFLAATTFAEEERDRSVQLPGSSAPQPMSAAPSSIIINISKDGQVKVGEQACTRDELKLVLKKAAEANAQARAANEPQQDILLRCDKDARHEHFAYVLDLAYTVGFDKTTVGYEFQKKLLDE